MTTPEHFQRPERKDTQEAILLDKKLQHVMRDPLASQDDRGSDFQMLLERSESPEFVQARRRAQELLETGDLDPGTRDLLEDAVKGFDADVQMYKEELGQP